MGRKSICPGTIYSPTNRYRNFIRLSFGHPWTEAFEAGVARLGELVDQTRRPAGPPAQ